MKKSTKIIIGVVVLAVLIGVFALVYSKFSAKPSEGGKNITVEVTNSEGSTESYALSTDAEYLIEAMDELSDQGFSYDGTDSEYGIMIEVINGEQAIFTEDGAYWALYVNGEYGNYGADSQPLADGDTYTWTYEIAQ